MERIPKDCRWPNSRESRGDKRVVIRISGYGAILRGRAYVVLSSAGASEPRGPCVYRRLTFFNSTCTMTREFDQSMSPYDGHIGILSIYSRAASILQGKRNQRLCSMNETSTLS